MKRSKGLWYVVEEPQKWPVKQVLTLAFYNQIEDKHNSSNNLLIFIDVEVILNDNENFSKLNISTNLPLISFTWKFINDTGVNSQLGIGCAVRCFTAICHWWEYPNMHHICPFVVDWRYFDKDSSRIILNCILFYLMSCSLNNKMQQARRLKDAISQLYAKLEVCI